MQLLKVRWGLKSWCLPSLGPQLQTSDPVWPLSCEENALKAQGPGRDRELAHVTEERTPTLFPVLADWDDQDDTEESAVNCMGPGQALGGGKSEPGFGVT